MACGPWVTRWCGPGRPAASPRRRFTPPAPPAATRRTEAMPRAPGAPPPIHRFGGASLANAAGGAHAVTIVVAYRPSPQVVVVSAMGGGTGGLRACAARASRGDAAHVRPAAQALRARHAEAARALVPRGVQLDELVGLIDAAFAELEQLAGGLGILRELTPRTIDYLVARGERLSARLFVAALEAAGCPAGYVDATEVVQADGTFGNASPDLGRTMRSARRAVGPVLARGLVPVVPGFLGAAPDGQVATLGRGGSDLTATLLARVLGAREVSLWKDVPGLLTADPRIVPDARVVPQVHLREAAELAYYGAKVLHPRSLVPVMKQNVAIRIRPFADPASLGTEISRRRTLEQYPVKALLPFRSRRCSRSRAAACWASPASRPGPSRRCTTKGSRCRSSPRPRPSTRSVSASRRKARSARAAAWSRRSSGRSRGRKSTASRRAPVSRPSWWWGSAWRRRPASPPASSPPWPKPGST